MDEASFWSSLEFRLCREFADAPEGRIRRLWCDGVVPSEYVLDGPSPRINGRAWICDGPRQAHWEFALLLPRAVGSRAEIDWAALLPSENATRGLSIDAVGRRIEIEPAAAGPDLCEPGDAADDGA